jgi:hypothetical protein
MPLTKFSQISFLFLALIFAIAAHSRAEAQDAIGPRFWIQSEAASVWQTKNDVQIPSDTGSRFSLVDLGGTGPKLAGRLYLGYRLNEKDELRVLYAPLSIDLDGTASQPISFQGETFTTGNLISAKYVFNSYRLTYRHIFLENEKWTLRVGFTGKIRDAEIRLTQGPLQQSRKNVGFVPLLHFSGAYRLCPIFNLHFDIDALAAPQGRAEDIALLAGYEPNERVEVLMGYRMVEGGADGGGGVYSFAWLHYAVAGLIYRL